MYETVISNLHDAITSATGTTLQNGIVSNLNGLIELLQGCELPQQEVPPKQQTKKPVPSPQNTQQSTTKPGPINPAFITNRIMTSGKKPPKK